VWYQAVKANCISYQHGKILHLQVFGHLGHVESPFHQMIALVPLNQHTEDALVSNLLSVVQFSLNQEHQQMKADVMPLHSKAPCNTNNVRQ